ncbi:MAG: alpha/beta fold hydrolase [Solirubrobacterales bacterium]
MSRAIRLLALFAATCALATITGPAAASAQESPSEYCDPSASFLDPPDVPAAGSGSAATAEIRERTITVGEQETRLLESGPRKGRTAVVMVHGIPGSAADWSGLMPRLANRRTRAVAFDMPGFGHAADAWGIGRTADVGAEFLNQTLAQLGIRRVHLVAHDIGGPVSLEWAKSRPRRLRSATLINTGLLLGYQDHMIAQISRPAGSGEAFWLGLRRDVFVAGIQNGQTRPVPTETLNGWYDDLDRETRCTNLETYRSGSAEEVDARARSQAAALARRPNRPALVIWGAEDPFLPVEMAARQREGFPRAQVEIFEQSGHWPFIDDPERTEELVAPFVGRAIERDRKRGRGR